MTAALLVVFWIISTGCALVDKGAGRKSECSRIAGLARSGEHKPAVDAYREMEGKGRSCPSDIQGAVSLSRSKLDKADAYVHKALKRRKDGNLLSARANLQLALEIYPRYYWVQTLIKKVERSIQAELDSLKHEAVYFESNGDPEGALSRIQDAMNLSPGDRGLESEAARLQKVIAGSVAQLSIQRRQENIRLRFEDAVEKEKKGDLTAAEGHTLYILEMSESGDPLSGRIVEFARLLGMKLYSAGELSRAKELWVRALAIDQGNLKLQGYLKEVETRLEKLDRIKKGGNEDLGK